MQKLNYTTTIAIDTERSEFHFYLMSGDDKSTIAHNIKNYSAPIFEDEFFNQFKDAIKEFATSNPSESVRKVNVVLPDNAVVTDVIKVPTMKGSMQMKKTLDRSLMLVTALNPYIGYENAARVAKKAYAENISLKDACVSLGLLSSEKFDEVFHPEKMI